MKNGFTLLETVMTLALCSIIFLSSLQLLTFGGATGEKLYKNREYLENGRIAMDFLTTQIRSARSFRLQTDNRNQLKRLEVDGFRPDGRPHTYLFLYKKDQKRLDFGGLDEIQNTEGANELASYIDDLIISHDTDKHVLYITLHMLDETMVFTKTLSTANK